MFEKIKKWYRLGLWNEAMVISAREKGVVTQEQAADILWTPDAGELEE